MGRRRAIRETVGPRALLAAKLDALCKAYGLTTFKAIAGASSLKEGTVRRLLNGDSVPDFSIIREITNACEAPAPAVQTLRQIWLVARSDERPAWYSPPYRERPGRAFRVRGSSTKPELIVNFAELRQGLKWLLFDAGSPSPRELEKRAGLNRLPHTTLERTLKGERLPSRHEVVALVETLALPDADPQVWGEAWDQCRTARFQRILEESRLLAQAIEDMGRFDPRIRDSALGAIAFALLEREGRPDIRFAVPQEMARS
ncbi:hypothetical protein [Kitasatospora sp. CB01950]|uniref:hypothetical protein n=1 Tax=Kitasatospora sp. CB01950 TaxID=1703930 RepID=UPI0011612380|nr:hypothetical protein [Kitasatospora sp. CB01950]